MKYKERKDLKVYKPKELEFIFTEIINKKDKNCIIGCIYKHPKMSVQEFDETYMSKIFVKVSHENKDIFLLGDFNINLLHYESHKQTATFLDNIYSNNFSPSINIPTRITPRSKTLIDNIFSNYIDSDMISGNITTCISDHLMQFLIKPSHEQKNTQNQKIYRRDFRHFNAELFKRKLNEKNWDAILNLEQKNVNLSFQIFQSTMENLLNEYAPFKPLSHKQQKEAKKPWITKGLLTSIKHKNKIYDKFCRAKDANRKKELYNTWKAYKNLILNLTRRSKESYYKTFFEENKLNSLKMWKAIKEIIHVKPTTRFTPNSLNIKGKLVTDTKLVTNEFNNFFSNIAAKIDSKIIKTETTFHDTLNNPNPNTLFLSPTCKKEVGDIIKKFKMGKASGPNSIHTNILQTYREVLSDPLCKLINLSFSNGTFPDLYKIAQIIPVHKKNDKLNCNNFRPISLLSNIGKIIEKLVHIRTYSFLEQNKCLYKHQFGFRCNHSTNHALINVTEGIRAALDANQYTCGVFLDFQKAFDTVNHDILLSKLEYYGIRGVSKNFFKSYLSNRKQFVQLHDTKSDTTLISHGVPQGSVLGPLLFLLYINDLHHTIKHSSMHHFADDTCLLYPNRSLKKINKLINHDLKLIVHWLRANRISLNVDKTNIIIFRPKNKKITKKLNFRISGQKIKTTTHTKYLGVLLDEHLTWNLHIKAIKTKLSRATGLLAKIRYHTSTDLRRTIYYALFDSHLRYACSIWAQSNNKNIQDLQDLQHKSIRVISFKNKFTPIDPLLKEQKIMTLKNIILLENCNLVLQYQNDNLPDAFENFFQNNNNQYDHNTRSALNKNIQIPQVNTTQYGLQSISYKCATDWNKIQRKINFNFQDEFLSKHKFSKAMKEYFFNH